MGTPHHKYFHCRQRLLSLSNFAPCPLSVQPTRGEHKQAEERKHNKHYDDRQKQGLGLYTRRLAYHRGTAQRLPTSPARDLLRVIREAVARGNSHAVVLDGIEHYPIPSFGNKTALEFIEAGRADDVIAYLRSLSGGWVGRELQKPAQRGRWRGCGVG